MSLIVRIEDLSNAKDHFTGHDSGGGYTDGTTIYIDALIPKGEQLAILFHEVIDGYIFRRKSNRIRHKDIDPLTLELIDALRQWEAYHDATRET